MPAGGKAGTQVRQGAESELMAHLIGEGGVLAQAPDDGQQGTLGLEHAEDPVRLGIAVELTEAPPAQSDQVLFQLRVHAFGVDAVIHL